MVLVDSSVWIDHLHKSNTHLFGLLERSEVSVHPMVIGELALGSIPNRAEIIELLTDLPSSEVAFHSEVMVLVESRKLFGRGLSLIDAHLLASVAISPDTTLWTRDKALRLAAEALNRAHAI
jgi:predicted nucleic acid-binding protein